MGRIKFRQNWKQREETKIDQENADTYLTEGLLSYYKRATSCGETILVPPKIFDLLVFAGKLKTLIRTKKLVRTADIKYPESAWKRLMLADLPKDNLLLLGKIRKALDQM